MSTYGVTKYGGDTYGGELISSLVPSYLGLRINFLVPVYDDAELRNPDNYTFSVVTTPAVNLECISVTPEPVTNPTYVDLECTDLTNSKTYSLTIASGKIWNAGHTDLYPSDTAQYTGVSINPVISSLRAISETEMLLIFSKTMAVNADLLDRTKYRFDNGLTVLEVTHISPGVVKLKTSKQRASQYYTLTVTV